MPHRFATRLACHLILALLLATSVACTGYLSSSEEQPASPKEDSDAHPDEEIAGGDEEFAPASSSGLRRLTSFEYGNAVVDLLGEQARPESELAQPTGGPFGNAAQMQAPTSQLIENAEALAKAAAQAALPDAERAAELMGCTAADDLRCLESFIRDLGRQALRRPLEDEEVTELLGLVSTAADPEDRLSSPKLVVQILLQHAEFLYRKELGQPVDGEPDLFRLDDYEIATRMAFLLWGAPPDEALLDAARDGELRSAAGRKAQAERMLYAEGDERRKTLRRIQQFHARWLGYHNSQLPGSIASAARRETDTLIEHLIFEERAPWPALLTFEKTFVDATLAEHYGLEHPGGDSPQWVSYADRRAGILSHATFLNTGTTVGVTSPTHRGKHIYERLFCGHVPPPPGNVNVDDQHVGKCGDDGFCVSPEAATDFACVSDEDCPEALACKSEHSAFYLRPGTGCAGCHRVMDPIGLGLEQFDHTGAWRTMEEPKPVPEGMDQPECQIEGQGEAPGLDTFSGPGELGQLLSNSEELTKCMMRYYYQFAWGLTELPGAQHQGAQALHQVFRDEQEHLLDTLAAIVSSEAFVYRRALANEGSTQTNDELDQPVEVIEGVDLGIYDRPKSPSIDGNCSEFSDVEPVSFSQRDDGYDNRVDCRLSWNGELAQPRLNACCVIRDQNLEAHVSGQDPNDIWHADGMAFVVTGFERERTGQLTKVEVSLNEAVHDASFPGGEYDVSYDAAVSRAVTEQEGGYVVEWSADIAADIEDDPRVYCEFRNNDRDNAQASHSHVFGDVLLEPTSWGICQFVNSNQ